MPWVDQFPEEGWRLIPSILRDITVKGHASFLGVGSDFEGLIVTNLGSGRSCTFVLHSITSSVLFIILAEIEYLQLIDSRANDIITKNILRLVYSWSDDQFSTWNRYRAVTLRKMLDVFSIPISGDIEKILNYLKS